MSIHVSSEQTHVFQTARAVLWDCKTTKNCHQVIFHRLVDVIFQHLKVMFHVSQPGLFTVFIRLVRVRTIRKPEVGNRKSESKSVGWGKQKSRAKTVPARLYSTMYTNRINMVYEASHMNMIRALIS